MSNKVILAFLLAFTLVSSTTVAPAQVAEDSVFSANYKLKQQTAQEGDKAKAAILDNGSQTLMAQKSPSVEKPLFSITESYLETLKNEKSAVTVEGLYNPDQVEKIYKNPLTDLNFEQYIQDTNKKTLVLQVWPKAVKQPQIQKPEIVLQKAPYGSMALSWPISKGAVSSHFGMRDGRPHEGADIVAKVGTPILSAADGEVVFADYYYGYGLLVEVLHPNGMKTRYAHCSLANVKPGQKVKRGQVIAAVGMTGHTTGPHVHFEVLIQNRPVNPMQFLKV